MKSWIVSNTEVRILAVLVFRTKIHCNDEWSLNSTDLKTCSICSVGHYRLQVNDPNYGWNRLCAVFCYNISKYTAYTFETVLQKNRSNHKLVYCINYYSHALETIIEFLFSPFGNHSWNCIIFCWQCFFFLSRCYSIAFNSLVVHLYL